MAGMGTLQAITTDTGNFPDVYLVPDFLGQSRASRLLATLWAELNWTQHEISLFGRRVYQPRLSCWYGDPGAHYTYSGLHLQPSHWHPALEDIRRVLEDTVDTRFNSVLANAYRNGRDSMGWHADDEKELGEEPTIASLSLGACRRFLLRERHGNKTICLALEPGSLLVMQGASQSVYRHSLPKTSKPVGLRINLTFRMVLNR